MTYIIVENVAQDRYVISYIIFMGIIRTTQKPFLIPYVNFGKKAFNIIWKSMVCLQTRGYIIFKIKKKIPAPFEQRSNLFGFEDPCNKNWAFGKESLIFFRY